MMEVHTCHNGNSADVPRAKILSEHMHKIKTNQPKTIKKLGNELNSILTIFEETVPDNGCGVSVDDAPG